MSGSADQWPGQEVKWPGQEVNAPPPASTIGRRLGLGVRDVVEGVAGPVYDLAGAPFRAMGVPVNRLSQNLTALGLPEPQTPGERMTSAIAQPIASTLTGQGIGRAMMGAASPVVQAVGQGLTAQPAMQAASAGVGGAVQEATGSPLAGLAAAAAVPVVGMGVSRLISPVRTVTSPEREALVAGAQREGIPLSPGQETGSRVLKNAEAALAQLPGAAGGAARDAEAQQQAFTAAVLRRADVSATNAGPDVIAPARARIGGEIGDIANRNTLVVAPPLEAKLAQVEASLPLIGGEAAGSVKGYLDRLRGMISPPAPGVNAPPTIPGASYRMMDSDLGRAIKATSNGDKRAALADLRDTLRSAMDASISPEDAGRWQLLRRHYANLMVAADAASGAGAGAAEGQISPLALRSAVDRSTGGGYEWGRGDLNQLARIGQSVLRGPPDSGTAGRGFMNSLLTGSLPISGAGAGAMLGGVPGAMIGSAASMAMPAAVGAMMRSSAGRAYLTNQVAAGLVDPRVIAAVTANLAVRNRLMQD